MTTESCDLSVLIVNYNGAKHLRDCLAAVLSLRTSVRCEVICVDNGSTDDSLHILHEHEQSVHLIPLLENVGFARGNNVAAARARGEFLLLLNTDAFATAAVTNALMAAMRADPSAAAIAPRLLSGTGVPQDGAYGYHPTWWRWLGEFSGIGRLPGFAWARVWRAASDCGASGSPVSVDWVSGACMLVRRRAWLDVGPFSERFFMYLEDAEWCARARNAGWCILFDQAHGVTHLYEGSADGSARWVVSVAEFERQSHGRFVALLVCLGGALGYAARAVTAALVAALTSAPSWHQRTVRFTRFAVAFARACLAVVARSPRAVQ